jgi:hypothetical protein
MERTPWWTQVLIGVVYVWTFVEIVAAKALPVAVGILLAVAALAWLVPTTVRGLGWLLLVGGLALAGALWMIVKKIDQQSAQLEHLSEQLRQMREHV